MRCENKPEASIHLFIFFYKSVLFILFYFFSLHPRPSIVAWTSIASISWRPSTSGSSTNSTRSRSWNSSCATTEGNFKICCFFRFPPSPRLLCVFCEAKAKRGKQVHGWVYSNRGRCGGQAGGYQKQKKKKTCWCWTTDSAGLSLILMLVTHHEIFLISLLRLSASINLLSWRAFWVLMNQQLGPAALSFNQPNPSYWPNHSRHRLNLTINKARSLNLHWD